MYIVSGWCLKGVQRLKFEGVAGCFFLTFWCVGQVFGLVFLCN